MMSASDILSICLIRALKELPWAVISTTFPFYKKQVHSYSLKQQNINTSFIVNTITVIKQHHHCQCATMDISQHQVIFQHHHGNFPTTRWSFANTTIGHFPTQPWLFANTKVIFQHHHAHFPPTRWSFANTTTSFSNTTMVICQHQGHFPTPPWSFSNSTMVICKHNHGHL